MGIATGIIQCLGVFVTVIYSVSVGGRLARNLSVDSVQVMAIGVGAAMIVGRYFF